MTEEIQFKYETESFKVSHSEDMKLMADHLAKRYNQGWRPTSNGPALAIPITKQTERFSGPRPEHDLETTTWLLVYVFAKEKPRGRHVN